MITLKNKKKSFEKVTGLGKFEVVGFNLTKEQLAAHGVNLNKEPEFYSVREEGQQHDIEAKETVTMKNIDQFKLNVWLKLKSDLVAYKELNPSTMQYDKKYKENPCKDQLYRVTFTIENREWTSAKNWTKCFMNGVGKSRWGANKAAFNDEKGKWFIGHAPIYPALRGLPALYDFILAWTNIDTSATDSAVLLGGSPEAINTIFDKDDNSIVEELNGYAESLKGCLVTGLLGVNGEWAAVYDKFIGDNFTNKDSDRLELNALSEYGFKADWQGSLELQIFDPMASLAQTTNQNQSTPTVDIPASSDGAIVADDLPF